MEAGQEGPAEVTQLLAVGPGRLPPLTMLGWLSPLAPSLCQACRLVTDGAGVEKGKGRSGVWLCFLNSASVLLSSPLAFLSLLSLPGVSGGGKAQAFAKLMTCLCAKLTGGWTSTQTLLMASRLLCWRPRSPVLAPYRWQPLPTPMLVALAPLSTPEPPGPPSVLRSKT